MEVAWCGTKVVVAKVKSWSGPGWWVSVRVLRSWETSSNVKVGEKIIEGGVRKQDNLKRNLVICQRERRVGT